MKKRTLKFSAVFMICFMFLFSAMPVFADESTPPSLPMSVSGSVVSTTGAPASGSIEAILDGKTVGTIAINSNGSFGGSGLVPQLLVQGSYSENNDHPVTFKVNGGSATASMAITFHAGTNITNVIITATVASPPTPVTPVTPGGSGGAGGPGGPGVTVPEKSNTVTPIGSNAVPVEVDTSKNVVKPTKDAKGHVTNNVTQDGPALIDALKKAAAQDNHGDAPIVFIPFNNPTDEAVVFNISLSVLATAATTMPNAIISLQTNDGEYSLPLSIIDFTSLAQSLGTTSANINIQIHISTVNKDINAKIKTDAQDISSSQQGSAIEFSITAEGNGKTVELNNFGSTYVDRTIVLTIPIDAIHATVVLYDPTTGQFSFVPALFEKQSDGSTKVTFKRNGNSIYTVLSSTKSFDDVSKHWAKADIELMANKLIVKGATDTSFAPDNNITRAEFTALLVRALGLTSDTASATFTDVISSDWFAGSVGAAVKAKLVSGFEDNSFKPNDTITREQMAVMIASAIKAAGKKVADPTTSSKFLASFDDRGSISSWAQVAVSQSIEAKIISGMTDTTLVPSANASRAQAVVMLKRLMQYVDFIN
ncbi:S-layer homology domain-containing protein [Paenibacillus sp. Soil750]|uniref:S-layer homology domain-containing protein n=1 Tax=Paenibacillus sp. Soil750 TaxID=1736398 RepID=UPI0006FEA140|nr:S-layer homology domain-containing protein [Paenibacillus sp. Soil750]KRE58386.1 hypothetical protein ASL11_28975 [Paenibacillus sp. Soil750]